MYQQISKQMNWMLIILRLDLKEIPIFLPYGLMNQYVLCTCCYALDAFCFIQSTCYCYCCYCLRFWHNDFERKTNIFYYIELLCWMNFKRAKQEMKKNKIWQVMWLWDLINYFKIYIRYIDECMRIRCEFISLMSIYRFIHNLYDSDIANTFLILLLKKIDNWFLLEFFLVFAFVN